MTRDEALKKMQAVKSYMTSGNPIWSVTEIGEAFDMAIEALEQQTAQQWIPCSETVDIPEHEVLCCDKYGEELIGWLSCEDDQWVCESEVEIMYDPVAWMEKPKPWEGEP